MNSGEYPVQVKLSTIGGDEIKSNLGNIASVARILQGSLNDAAASGMRLSAGFKQANADGTTYSLTMKSVAGSTKTAADATDQLSSSTKAMSSAWAGAMSVFVAAGAVIYKIGEAFVDVTAQGIEFNSFVERNRLAISALTLTFSTYVDELGRPVESTRQWADASADAADQQRMLLAQSLQSAASFKDLAGVYQMMYGAMVAGGAKTKQEMVLFTGTVADMAAVMGTSYDKAARQMSLALMGVTRTTGQLGAMLRTMGIDNATLKSWREQGTVVENLQAKLHAFLEMQPMLQNTWVGITTNMKTAWQLFAGAIAEDVFKPLKDTMQSALHDVLDFSTGELTQGAAQIARTIGAAVSGAFDVSLTAIKQAFSVVSGELDQNGMTWLDVFKRVAMAMVSFFDLAAKAVFVMTELMTSPVATIDAIYSALFDKIIERFASTMRMAQAAAASLGMYSISLAAGGVAGVAESDLAKYKESEKNSSLVSGLDAITDASAKAMNAIMKIGPTWDTAFKRDTIQQMQAFRTMLLGLGQDTTAVDAQIELMSRVLGMKGGDKSVPTKPEVDNTKYNEAVRKYLDSISLLTSKASTGGLDGLDLALAKNEESFNREAVAIDSFSEKMENAAKGRPEVIAAVEALKAGLLGVAAAAKAANDDKSVEQFGQKFEDAVSKINSIAMDDSAFDKIDKKWNDNLRKLTDDYETAKRALGSEPLVTDIFDPASVARAVTYYSNLGRLNSAYADAVQRNNEQMRLSKQKVEAEQLGDADAYYDAVKKMAILAGQTQFQAMQGAAKATADMLFAQADTLQKGFNAGLAAIRASITSFGQDVSSLMTSVWGDLTKSFEDGFYDILTGKFDSLGDVLKGLWDSILKDFSKMLAQMLVRWIATGDAMGNGQGSGGAMGWLKSLLGGSGDSAVYTPGGTDNNGSGFIAVGNNPGMGQYTTSGNIGSGGSGGGLGAQGYGAIAGYAGGALLAYNAFSKGFSKTPGADISYNGTSLGQSTDFGGNAKFGDYAAAAAAIGAATIAAYGVAALATSVVPVVGWIAAAAILIVGAIVSIMNGPKEGHFYAAISDAFEKTGAKSAVGSFVSDVIESTANFVGELAMKAAGPEGVATYVAAYHKAFQDALGSAKFDFHAGSGDDLNKDVTDFFNKTLPKLAMQAAFGQVGIGQPGGASAIAGMDWNTNNGNMDAAGNWIKNQLYDPNAPIPMLLAGIGFSQDKIAEIASKLSTSTDMAAFKKYLEDLVDVVVGLGNLATAFGRTTSEWFSFLRGEAAQQGTAAQFTSALQNLQNQGSLLDTLFGDDRVAAAKQLVTDSNTLLDNMSQALQSILTMVDQIATTTAQTTQAYKDKLLTPGQLEAQARAAYGPDMSGINSAANPQAVSAAWQQVMKDLSAVLDAIVARIQEIKALQQSYADFRTQMATDAGPQFATDPRGWLAQNGAAISAVTATLATATGEDAITGARTLLQLVQERYTNELAMLQQVDSAIKSINDQSTQAIQNLTLQSMGTVTVDPKTGQKTFTPDVHAQGDYLNSQFQALMGQLGSATSPEQVTSLMSQINGIISQLAAQPQDPAHYVESRNILISMTKQAQDLANQLLGNMHDSLTKDLKGVGDLLAAGEKTLNTALTAASDDFTTELGLMSKASTSATAALLTFADGITLSMNDVVKAINHWIWVMTHPDGAVDPNYKDPNAPAHGTVVGGYVPTSTGNWEEDPTDPAYEINTRTGARRKKATAPAPVPKTTGGGAGGHNVTVTVNSGSAEEIAKAAADAVYDQTLAMVRGNNVQLVRAIRNNPSLVS